MAKRLLDCITDVTGIKVGHWTDRRNATGCTVVLCEGGAMPGVDVRGGAPGTMETDLMRTGYSGREVHGILLAGGSVFGLEAQAGVVRWCEEHAIGVAFGGRSIPIVPAAIIFDLGVGVGEVRPNAAAGYAAAAAARAGRVAEGSVGVGTGAAVSGIAGRGRRMKGGVGSASEELGGGLIVAALVAVNCVGAVYDSASGKIIAGPRADGGGFIEPLDVLRNGSLAPQSGENTTIGVIATNVRLTKEQTNRLATLGHDGLARAIRPVHTLADGDTLFALATGEVELDHTRVMALEAYAAVVVERAIVKAVRAATTLAGVPAIRDL